MRRRALVGVLAAALAGAVLARRARRRQALLAATTRSIAPGDARALVEAVLGQRPRRLPLAINFAPAMATAWDVLIDGRSFFPPMLADIEAATSDVHIIIFGFKDGEIGRRMRDLLLRKVGEGVPVRLLVEAGYSQPGLESKAFYGELVAGGVQVTANQVGSSRVDLQACKLEYSIVSPK